MRPRLQLLGALRLTLDGTEVALPSSRKARLLLARLAVDRRVHGRSELAGGLWPDVREDSARVSLRTALVQLRAALGDTAGAVLGAQPDGGLALAAGVETDLAEVEALMAAGEPEAALDRCRGDLLAGFDEDWAHARRDDLRDRLIAALAVAAAAAEARGDLEAAARLTRRQTGLDPLAEAAHRDLIRRLAKAGDRAAALAADGRFRARLAAELGIAPSAATRALAEEIRAEPRPGGPRTARARGGRDRDARGLVGRADERAELLRLLDPQGPSVSVVFGLAGVGKSALLRAFAADAAACGAAVIELDAAALTPTDAGFLAGVSAALGREVTTPTAAGEAIGAQGERVVVTLDAYERLRAIDPWVRERWLPALPDHVRLVVAARALPPAAWAAHLGPALVQFGLDSLSPADALELLRRLGVPPERAVRFNRVLRGHPLALQLVAATPPGVGAAADAALRLAIEELARLFLADVDAATLRALEAAAVVRRVTLSLLEAMLEGVSPTDALARLRELPFVWSGSEGLIVFHVVRSVVAAQLRSQDPARYRRLRAAAWRQLAEELRSAPRSDLWRYGADLLYVSDSPEIRDALFPNTMPYYEVEPARPDDLPAIDGISRRHQPRATAELLGALARSAPEAFRVARLRDGSVAGYAAVCEPAALPPTDPVAEAWRAHLRSAPPADGRRVLGVRHLLSEAGGEALGPAQAALMLDVVRRCLETGPELDRVYACSGDAAAAAARLEPLGFRALGRETSYVLELAARSPERWLVELAGRELG